MAAQAAWTKVVLSHLPPRRSRVLRRLPALSSLRGHRQAQDSRCPGVAKRDMSMPISATTTCALTQLGPRGLDAADATDQCQWVALTVDDGLEHRSDASDYVRPPSTTYADSRL